jgi:ankyrin repeat protein
MWAVGDYEPHHEVVRVLLDAGADVSIRSTGAAESPSSRSASKAAVAPPSAGLTALSFAVRQGDQESVRLLLGAGANVNDNRMPGGMTPLLMAINNGYEDLAVFLLDNGADPQAPNSAGFTPLHTVMRKRGANMGYAAGYHGSRPAPATAVVLKALLARGANPDAQLPSKPQPPNFNPIAYPPIMGVQYGGATPLWIAATNADLEAMRLLVAAGADPKKPAMLGTTPLMMAAGLGYGLNGPSTTLGDRREDTEDAVIAAVQQLLDWGNDINAVNDNGQTAVYGAAMAASPRVIQFLADHGARLDQKDIDGRTPLNVADDNRTDKFRSNQSLNPARLEPTSAVLRKLTGDPGLK